EQEFGPPVSDYPPRGETHRLAADPNAGTALLLGSPRGHSGLYGLAWLPPAHLPHQETAGPKGLGDRRSRRRVQGCDLARLADRGFGLLHGTRRDRRVRVRL